MKQTAVYKCLTTLLPATSPVTGEAILADGKPVYQKHFYCGEVLVNFQAKAHSWDTDSRYALRYQDETAAKNARTLLEGDAGLINIEDHPGNIAPGPRIVNVRVDPVNHHNPPKN